MWLMRTSAHARTFTTTAVVATPHITQLVIFVSPVATACCAPVVEALTGTIAGGVARYACVAAHSVRFHHRA